MVCNMLLLIIIGSYGCSSVHHGAQATMSWPTEQSICDDQYRKYVIWHCTINVSRTGSMAAHNLNTVCFFNPQTLKHLNFSYTIRYIKVKLEDQTKLPL